MEEKKNKGSFPWAFLGGAVSVAAWASAFDWQGPFDVLKYAWSVLSLTFFGALLFVLGYVPFVVAKNEKGMFEKVLTIAGGLAFDAGLIWFFFFR